MPARFASLLSQLSSVDASAWLPALADATLKGTLILAVAALLTAALRRSSAALRHFVWSVAVAAVVVLPVLARVLPAWSAPVVPAFVLPTPSASDAAIGGDDASGTASRAAPDAQTPAAADDNAPSRLASEAATSALLTTSSAAARTGVASATTSVAAPPPAATTARQTHRATRLGWIQLLALVWLGGAALVLLRLALGTLVVWRIAHRSERVTDPAWLALAQRTARELGLLRPVTLLASRRHNVPLTWGIVYPVVLLPDGADAWPEERRRLVLVHEMAHVDRFDALTQLVAQLGLALFWFHPLVWMAVSRMRAERERACDDCVIALGTRASYYADDLLTIVRTLEQRTGPAFAALAMARRSEFEGRLLAILDPSVPRQRVGRRGGSAVAAAALALVLPLSALRPWRAEGAVAAETPARAATPLSVLQPRTAAVPSPATSSLGVTLARTASSMPSVPSRSLASSGRGSRECRRTVYSGPGYHFTVGRGRQTSMHVVDDDNGTQVATVLIVNDTLCLFMDMTGKIAFNDDETDVASIAPGGHVVIERAKEGREQRLELVPDAQGNITRHYTENGQEADPATARTMLADLVPSVARELALDPNGRVARIRRRSGIAGVLRDVELTSSDGAKRKYYDALVTSGRIPADTLVLIAQTAARTISSDGDKAYVLERIDEQREATPAVHVAVATAARTISSDGDKRRVLQSAIQRSGGAVPAYAVAEIAGGISSDGDKSAVLIQIADRYDGSDSVRAAFFGAANTISSDGDRSRVLLALLRRKGSLDVASQVPLLHSAREISSDNDKAVVLAAFANEGALTLDAVRGPYFDAVNTISSDASRARVLLDVVHSATQSQALTFDVLKSAADMASDHSKAEVLTAVARTDASQLGDPALRARFISALKTISSDSEYRKVMDVLMK